MYTFEYTRKELVDDYHQLINQLKYYNISQKIPYQDRIPFPGQPIPQMLPSVGQLSPRPTEVESTYFDSDKYKIFMNTIERSDNPNEEYAKVLHQIFIDNPKLHKIVRILPMLTKQDIMNPSNNDSKLTDYILWIYKDNFVIEARFIDSPNTIKYNFTYPVDNYYNYDSIDFIKSIRGSVFFKYGINGYDLISKDIYLAIYKYYKEFINDPISFQLQDVSLEYKELKWDMLKQYLLYQPNKVVNYIEKNKYDISLLINMINLLYDSDINIDAQEYNQLVANWVTEYLNWYNLEGKKYIDNIKCLYVVEYEYDIDLFDNNIEDENGNYISVGDFANKNNKYYIDKYGKYGIIPKYVENNIDLLINQLYYKLAEYYIHNDINTTSVDDKRIILEYLEKADDYKDAKELKNKLFYQYIGLPFGKSLNININNPTIGDMFDLVIILKK